MGNRTMQWTVTETLEHVSKLGIPHFQRGLVWGTDTRSALLESLFLDTPCGAFVLWQPKSCAALGVPLDAEACTGIEYLIIDGQQRTRTLHAVFNDLPEDDDDDGEGEDAPEGRRKTWCINLSRATSFAGLLKPAARELSLFVRTIDPLVRNERGQPSQLTQNMVPLAVVLRAESWDSAELAPYRTLLRVADGVPAVESVAFRQAYADLRERACAMKDRRFFVSVQKNNDLAEMAALYNRINSGGKRVEVEERAFARLVGLQSQTYQELAAVFEAVHGVDADKGRDAVLRRQKERAFGFKLFIRVFLQVCQHHLGFQGAKSDFSFDLVNKAGFQTAFGKLDSDQIQFLWQETRRVVGHVRSVMREELYCDDLRMLPETAALAPVFQLLIHYPPLSEAQHRRLLASLLLRLMLAELDSKTLSKLVQEVGDPGKVASAAIRSRCGRSRGTAPRPRRRRRYWCCRSRCRGACAALLLRNRRPPPGSRARSW